MTATGFRLTGPALDEGQREVLAAALSDAVHYRDPDGFCADCEAIPACPVPGEPGRLAPGLCDDCAADLNLTDAYLQLAEELGIGVDL